MSSPGTTPYRLSIVTIGLYITVFALRSDLRVPKRQTDGRTDGRNWFKNRWHYALKLCHIKCDHPACVSVDGGHFEHIMVVALNMA